MAGAFFRYQNSSANTFSSEVSRWACITGITAIILLASWEAMIFCVDRFRQQSLTIKPVHSQLFSEGKIKLQIWNIHPRLTFYLAVAISSLEETKLLILLQTHNACRCLYSVVLYCFWAIPKISRQAHAWGSSVNLEHIAIYLSHPLCEWYQVVDLYVSLSFTQNAREGVLMGEICLCQNWPNVTHACVCLCQNFNDEMQITMSMHSIAPANFSCACCAIEGPQPKFLQHLLMN